MSFGRVFQGLLSACVLLSFPLSALADAESDAMHQKVFDASQYPAASDCGVCHEKHYREWAASPHSYAQLSPVFNAMHATTVKRNTGTNGDFCIRCHSAIGMDLGEPIFAPNATRSPVSREGVTCIMCHRVNKDFGKISGRLDLVKGDIYTPVTGPLGNEILNQAIADPDIRVKVSDDDPNTRAAKVHRDVDSFFHITTSQFCGICHDVTLMNGFRLEEAFSEYKESPAAKRGESCQDCHMGTEPGIASGYETGPAAVVKGYKTADRKLTDHMMIGPDHSVIHPGIFPHNLEAKAMATIDQWLQFDWRAGWGTEEWEEEHGEDHEFPEFWDDDVLREEARELIEEQLELLEFANQQRIELLRRGYRVRDIKVDEASGEGLKFAIEVHTPQDGHNAPTGFSGERLIYLDVIVRDASGKQVFRSGDLDPHGDVRDLHSVYVHDGLLPQDKYLFNLQAKFITRNIRGGEREQVLPINVSIDPLPYIRPSTTPTVLKARPGGARLHKRALTPKGSRWAKYKVTEEELAGSQGPYTATVRLYQQMVPINLIYEIQDVGFDYNLSGQEIACNIIRGKIVLEDFQVRLDQGVIKPGPERDAVPDQTKKDHPVLTEGMCAKG